MQSQVKKCIFKDYDKFKLDVLAALGKDVKLTCDLEGLYFECHEEPLSTEEILAGMSKYYGVKVTSIHIDDCEVVGVWICYTEEKELSAGWTSRSASAILGWKKRKRS